MWIFDLHILSLWFLGSLVAQEELCLSSVCQMVNPHFHFLLARHQMFRSFYLNATFPHHDSNKVFPPTTENFKHSGVTFHSAPLWVRWLCKMQFDCWNTQVPRLSGLLIRSYLVRGEITAPSPARHASLLCKMEKKKNLPCDVKDCWVTSAVKRLSCWCKGNNFTPFLPFNAVSVSIVKLDFLWGNVSNYSEPIAWIEVRPWLPPHTECRGSVHSSNHVNTQPQLSDSDILSSRADCHTWTEETTFITSYLYMSCFLSCAACFLHAKLG